MDWGKTGLTTMIPRPKELVDTIRARSTKITYPAKALFLEPGGEMGGIYYIAQGHTRHYMVAIDGTEKILYALSPGWFFGEAPYLLEQSTGLYSRTDTETTLYKISAADFAELMDTNPQFRDAVLECLSKKTLMLRHEVENLSFNSCKDRLKRLFCATADTDHLIDEAWYGLSVHYTQYDLSTIVGGARVTVSKLINELCAEGFIRVLNRRTQVNAREYAKYLSWHSERQERNRE